MRRLLLLVLALLLAGASTLAVRIWTGRQQAHPAVTAEAPPPAHKSVLVAARELHVGEFLKPEDLRWQNWPDVPLPATYLVAEVRDETELIGAVVRRPLGLGEPIIDGSVVKPGERGFLAAVLDPGMRALTVSVDETSSNAGLIFPGDRVDLILTQVIMPAGEGDTARRVSETVLENVRVIAMGRRLASGDEEAGAAQARTTTFELTPADAEKVALLADLGRLSLSLRSLAEAPAGSGPAPSAAPVTWDSDVSAVLRPGHQPRATLAVIRGTRTAIVNTAPTEAP